MPTEAKQAAVAELKDELSKSKAAIVADYRGLTVSDIQAVRRALRSEGITYRVVKNRLAKIAAQEAGREQLNELLEGPTALAMGSSDEVTLARAFLDAIRPYKSVVVRGGMIGETRIDAGSINRMASLPGREVLLAQLAGGMASPLATMASLLAAPLRNLAYALAQVAETKGQQARESEAPSAVAEAEAPKAEAAEAEATPEASQAQAEAPTEASEADAESPSEPETAETEAAETEAAEAETPVDAQATAQVAETPEADESAAEAASATADADEPAAHSNNETAPADDESATESA
jgi:large subunit ribosomal protein L10